ncbi:thioesterase II family protein [Kitasatospora aureofaciens]|uniref:thioesterase II family protein n=1 Tax=Kitasatospora aureofaciens TaxID=1894 RepID=UPI0037CAEFF3
MTTGLMAGRLDEPRPTTAYLTTTPSTDGRPRLFCFHHAGGGAAAYAALRRELTSRVDVLPVQLPGREGRVGDRLPATAAELVADLDRQLDPYLTGRYACYGHSMGALVAHDLVALRQARGAALPLWLIAGAARAPQLPAAFVGAHTGSEDQLVRAMLDIGGLSPQLLDYPDWLAAAVALTRGDLRLLASRDTAPGAALTCPVEVFHGSADPLVSEDDALAWQQRAAAGFRLHRFTGGHFFHLGAARAEFTDRLARLLTGPAPRPADADLAHRV